MKNLDKKTNRKPFAKSQKGMDRRQARRAAIALKFAALTDGLKIKETESA